MGALSDVFKYISHFRHNGHQVGRKVGDMLEVLTYAAIARESALHSRLHVEPKLRGFSGAGHKVEFTLLNVPDDEAGKPPEVQNGGEIDDPKEIFAFIECKKVGVEQTVNSSFKKNFKKSGNKYFKIPYDEPLSVSFARRETERHTYEVTLIKPNRLRITKKEDDKFLFEEDIANDSRIIFTLSDTGKSDVLGNAQSLRNVKYSLDNCRILEIVGLHEEHVTGVLNDCLPGPQTPEKAKQSSFVALDVRKKRHGSCDKQENEKEMISVLVLTEFTHWEQKSQNMIKAYVDKNLVVSDKLVVEAFIAFEKAFGADFYAKITKVHFVNDKQVRDVAAKVVDQYDGKIFRDLDDGKMKKLAYSSGELVFLE